MPPSGMTREGYGAGMAAGGQDQAGRTRNGNISQGHQLQGEGRITDPQSSDPVPDSGSPVGWRYAVVPPEGGGEGEGIGIADGLRHLSNRAVAAGEEGGGPTHS